MSNGRSCVSIANPTPFDPGSVTEQSVLRSHQISSQLGSELKTNAGFFRAQTHEKTTDLTSLDKIVYEKKNVNKPVEDELC